MKSETKTVKILQRTTQVFFQFKISTLDKSIQSEHPLPSHLKWSSIYIRTAQHSSVQTKSEV